MFVGTVWPLLAELITDRKLSVGPPFFNIAFTPFMVALAIILPIGSTLPWKRAKWAHLYRLWPIALFCLACTSLTWAVQTGKSLIGPVGFGLGVWLVVGVIIELYQRTGSGLGKWRRLLRLPLADWGKATAHAGLGIIIFGVAGITAWQTEDIRVMAIGESVKISGFTITLNNVEELRGPNYLTTMADIKLARGGRVLAILHPERRYYPVAEMPTTEAGIDSGLWRDVYIVVGDAQPEGGYAVRTFVKPLANWIWTGAIIMALGGLLSLFDRRYRVASATRRGSQGAGL